MRLTLMEERPVFVYQGGLRDTAALVGLKNIGVSPGRILYEGEKTFAARRYLAILNHWLGQNGMPLISQRDTGLSPPRFQIEAGRLLAKWRWGPHECEAVIRLAGLPIPPPSC